MPLTKIQSDLLCLLANQRSPESYIAGGVALNRDGPRFSNDIDIFHDGDERLLAIAEGDAAIIETAGYALQWLSGRKTGKHTALVRLADTQTQLEWVADSDFRFFPAQRDALFGYVLHPADLATNKAAAAADRRVPRDIIDLVTIHETILPLGAVIAAAVGRFPGMTPEEMLADIRRHGTFTTDEFQSLAVAMPIDPRQIQRRIKTMLADATQFIQHLPSEAVGFLFLSGEKPVQPIPGMIDSHTRHAGARRGHWPSSSDIGAAMLDCYKA